MGGIHSDQWTSQFCNNSVEFINGENGTYEVFEIGSDATNDSLVDGELADNVDAEQISHEQASFQHLQEIGTGTGEYAVNEALAVLNMPEELRVNVSQLHIFSNPHGEANIVEKQDNTDLGCTECADCCADSEECEDNCCPCKKIAKAYVHDRKFLFITGSDCYKVSVTKEMQGNAEVYTKHHVVETSEHCDHLISSSP